MTRAELIGVIAKVTGITKGKAAKALDAYEATVTKELKKSGTCSCRIWNVLGSKEKGERRQESSDR
jgi:nucleoid DNA-binding protein